MPESPTVFDSDIQLWFRGHVEAGAEILDVGPGIGKYARLLRAGHPNLDAVEIFAPYVEMFGLRALYRSVFIGDVRTFDLTPYSMVIIGDVLEHLSIGDARAVLARCRRALVQVPYLYPQGTIYDNPAETHLQPDLTEKVMAERYPELTPLFVYQGVLGVYTKGFGG
jgi:2-polyprenyl-3-methyl-5-hydroxy-6-metoxy-1,4-benzoquinol methylase